MRSLATQALESFEVTAAAIRELMRLEAATYNDPPPPRDEATVSALRAGVCVLLVAAFERYLRDSFEEEVSRLRRCNPPCDFDRLPSITRATSSFHLVTNATDGLRLSDNPDRYLERLAALNTASRLIADGKLVVEAFVATRSNPSPCTVNRMFAALDIQDVVDSHAVKAAYETRAGKLVASRFVKDKLSEIVNRRHNAAHSADALSVSRGDLTEAVTFISHLAPILDTILTAQISSFCGLTAVET